MTKKEILKRLVRKARKLDKECIDSDLNIRVTFNTEFSTRLEEDSKKYTTYSYVPQGIDLRSFNAYSVMRYTTLYKSMKARGDELIDKLVSFFVEEKEHDIDFLRKVNLLELLEQKQEETTRSVSDDK